MGEQAETTAGVALAGRPPAMGEQADTAGVALARGR
jgi:hypothetical protein